MNDKAILVEWERPLTPNGKILLHKVFRGQEMLAKLNASNSSILRASQNRKSPLAIRTDTSIATS